MTYKLGKGYKPYMTNGNIRTKLRFSQEAGGDASVPGSIFINQNIVPGSDEEKQVINHEMRHSTDMRIGKLAYGDNFVKYNGETYLRQTINGKDMIIVDGVAKEAGAHDFPWEQEANTGNGNI